MITGRVLLSSATGFNLPSLAFHATFPNLIHRDELLADITRAFEAGLHPAPAPAEAPAAFQGAAWPAVPDAALREQAATLAALSLDAFRYYLPAWLRLAVREPETLSLSPLLAALKLPTELPGPALTQLLARFETGSPPAAAEVSASVAQQLRETNQALHRFVARTSGFSPPQGRAILHFLTYFQAAGDTAASQQATLAIERYWFQFA